MRYLVVAIAVAGHMFTSDPAVAQEKFTIKLKEPGQGDASRVEIVGAEEYKGVAKYEKQKEPATETRQRSTHTIYIETILLPPDDQLKPTKLKRVYERAEEKRVVGTDKREESLAFQGKTIIIEKKGAKYEYRYEGGVLLEPDAISAILGAYYGGMSPSQNKKSLAPSMPVAVDETWKIDPNGLMPSLANMGKEFKSELFKAEGTAKLVKVYCQGDRLYGIIDATVEVHAKSKRPSPNGQVESERKFTISIRLDGCIDGAVADAKITRTTQTTHNSISRSQLQGTTTIDLLITSNSELSWKELPKK